ncbi:hypothetical protein NPN14_23665, partial [Vibrio parahaemolyticus]|uniref:glycerophosphodiester phosphodiesterase n=1 Tax=Vibrio parahaemolyticus TaxID=670 RepID=UPI0021131E2C
KGEKIPTLDETIASIPESKRLVIEIKCGPEVLPELERVIKASGRKDAAFVIIGFNYEVVRQAKQLFPNIPVFYLSSFKKNAETGALTPSLTEL